MKRSRDAPPRLRKRLGGSPSLPSSERVYRALRQMIIDGQIPPGERLFELQLASQFGVSRTPVREALKRLVDADLVVMDSSRAYVVSSAETVDIDDVYLVREILDGLAARLAARRIVPNDIARLRIILESMSDGVRRKRPDIVAAGNIAFHDLLYSVAGSRTLTRLGGQLRDFVRRYSQEVFADPGRAGAVVREHQRLVKCLEQGDSHGAERAALEHMAAARAHIANMRLRSALRV